MSRVLVIDDDPMVRESLALVLEEGGHAVCMAKDGCAGLAMLDELKPDIVITDLVMPRIDGLETIAQIRRRSPGTPILVVSGGGTIGNYDALSRAADLGADRIMHKPVRLRALLDMVNELTLGPQPAIPARDVASVLPAKVRAA